MRPRQSSSVPSNEGLNRGVVLILCIMNVHDNLEVLRTLSFRVSFVVIFCADIGCHI